MTTLADCTATAHVFWTFRILSLCAALANPAELVKPLPDVCHLKPVEALLPEVRNDVNAAERFACGISHWREVRLYDLFKPVMKEFLQAWHT
jgi:hypothetical protein